MDNLKFVSYEPLRQATAGRINIAMLRQIHDRIEAMIGRLQNSTRYKNFNPVTPGQPYKRPVPKGPPKLAKNMKLNSAYWKELIQSIEGIENYFGDNIFTYGYGPQKLEPRLSVPAPPYSISLGFLNRIIRRVESLDANVSMIVS